MRCRFLRFGAEGSCLFSGSVRFDCGPFDAIPGESIVEAPMFSFMFIYVCIFVYVYALVCI